MAGLTDGTAHVVLMQGHPYAIEINTYRDCRDVVEDLINTVHGEPRNHIAWLETLPKLIQETVERLNQEWFVDEQA